MSSILNLDPGETIVREVRKHWYVLLSRGLFLVFLACAPLFIGGIINSLLPFSIVTPVSTPALETFLYSLWLLGIWVSFFVYWTNYYLDVWFITEKRIIDVEQVGVFHRRVSNLRFDKIQDISIEIRGVVQTWLGFGDIRVQTAAENEHHFFMKNASDPDGVRRIIFSHHNIEHEKARPVTVVERPEQ